MELAIIVVLDSCFFKIDVDSFDVNLGELFHSIIYIYLMFLFLYGFLYDNCFSLHLCIFWFYGIPLFVKLPIILKICDGVPTKVLLCEYFFGFNICMMLHLFHLFFILKFDILLQFFSLGSCTLNNPFLGVIRVVFEGGIPLSLL
jgi:hypothetical protein